MLPALLAPRSSSSAPSPNSGHTHPCPFSDVSPRLARKASRAVSETSPPLPSASSRGYDELVADGWLYAAQPAWPPVSHGLVELVAAAFEPMLASGDSESRAFHVSRLYTFLSALFYSHNFFVRPFGWGLGTSSPRALRYSFGNTHGMPNRVLRGSAKPLACLGRGQRVGVEGGGGQHEWRRGLTHQDPHVGRALSHAFCTQVSGIPFPRSHSPQRTGAWLCIAACKRLLERSKTPCDPGRTNLSATAGVAACATSLPFLDRCVGRLWAAVLVFGLHAGGSLSCDLTSTRGNMEWDILNNSDKR